MSNLTPQRLDRIEAFHNDGHDLASIVSRLGISKRGMAAWRIHGVVGFHDGAPGGMGGEGWTRAEAAASHSGWIAAAKHSGLRKVTGPDCARGVINCADCNQEQGEWHIMGCSKLVQTPTPEPVAEPLALVWSNKRNAWWRPKCSGYTDDVSAAGVFTLPDARSMETASSGEITARPLSGMIAEAKRRVEQLQALADGGAR